jgi:hypothetical protein
LQGSLLSSRSAVYRVEFSQWLVERSVDPPGESGGSKLIETMLPHRY